ncbi:MAG: helix-turn-helix domain-containing protein [Thermomicrobiales bacterium]
MSTQPTDENLEIVPAGGWLSIREACAFLGVDQSTLRRWTNDGRVPVFKTPGGHRRYAREDLRALVVGNPRKTTKSRVSRQELTSRTLSAYQDDYLKTAREQKWFRAFGATSQEEHRRIGRRLVDLAIRYAATPGQQEDRAELLDEGREIGVHYGTSSARAGLSTSETIEVFLYFRYPVVKALLDVIEKEGLPARRASRLFIGIDDFIDEVLVAMIRAHGEASGAEPRNGDRPDDSAIP